MRLGRHARWALVLGPVAGLLAVVSCSSKSTPQVGLASGCSLNSDCDNPLVCIFSLCHQQCSTSRDCNDGAQCLFPPSANGAGVCELPSETSCSSSQPCQNSQLTCGINDKCVVPCSNGTCTGSGQQCTQGGCYGPGDLDGGSGGDGSPGEGGPSEGGHDGSGDAISDGPPLDAGPLGFVPSNFGTLSFADGGVPEAGEGGTSIVSPDGGLDFTDAPDVVVSGNATNATALPPHVVISLGTNPPMFADVYVIKTFTVDSSANLTFNDPNPVILAVLGAVDIGGEISVGGYQYVGYAGAPTWTGPTSNQGPGGGGNGFTANFPMSGGGGGTFCGVGGKGGAPSGTPAIGGSTYGNATLTPLLAGSGGGYANGNQWGAGGGALQISSGSSILIRGVGIVNAGGGSAYGGGGSGGAILLEAPTIDIQGYVTANGGGGGGYSTSFSSAYGNGGQTNNQPATGGVVNGETIGGSGSAGTTITGSDGTTGDASVYYGSGGGGAGWIRLNTSSGSATITGTVSPALGTACASQGTLN